MNEFFRLYAVSSELLTTFEQPQLGVFSAWLHFERQWNDIDKQAVTSLIMKGCRYVLITGTSAESVHDKVDDAAYSATSDLVLTSFKAKADRNAAFEFITTRCPGAYPTFFLLSVFSIDSRFETIALAENLKLIGLEMAHP